MISLREMCQLILTISEEQLALVDKEIEATESSLKNLRLKRKDLKIKIEEQQKDELYRLVQNSGKSLEEVIAMLKEEKEEN